MSRYRVSMDIGGTFTDVVAYDEESGTYTAGKSSTTTQDLTEGVFAALGAVVDTPADIGFTVHGTTQGLNAFLQRRGEKVLLLATKGAGDVYHIARGNRTRTPEQTADRFAKAWLGRPGMTTEEWQAGLRPLSTPALREKLTGAEPESVPAEKVTGPPTMRERTETFVELLLPLDTGGLRLELVTSDDGWLVDVLDWERP